jgi:PadR family transcriptional regulator, regulatory protein PadR
MQEETLGQFETLILHAIIALQDDAWGLRIHTKLCEMKKRQFNQGSVYVTLGRLEKKGYVKSKVAENGPEQGGRPRKLYTLQPPGARAMLESVDTMTQIADFYKRGPKWKRLLLKLAQKRR